MSTHRFAIAVKNAPKIVTPITDGKSAEDRRDGVLADPRQVEDRLGDERPGQDAGQVEPEHRPWNRLASAVFPRRTGPVRLRQWIHVTAKGQVGNDSLMNRRAPMGDRRTNSVQEGGAHARDFNGHLLPVTPLVELPDDVGADLARGGQDPKEIPTSRWSERVSEASRILPKHRGASVSAAWPPGELPDQPLDRLEVESEGQAVTLCGRRVFANVA
jgi:hypothetical protein